MYFEDATKEQLLQICLYENCPLDYKYEAARELQMRQWRDEYLEDLVRLWGEGKSSFQIAVELGIDQGAVLWQLEKHHMYRKRNVYIPGNNNPNSIMVEISGKTLCLADWSRKTGIKYRTLIQRYKSGDRGKRLIRKVRSVKC